jgi:hypothetical protein
MRLHRALFLAAALVSAFGICLALYRQGAGGNGDLFDIAGEVRRGEDLEPHFEPSRRLNEAKLALAAEVVDGRMSLREAAGRFRRLDEAAPVYPPGISRYLGNEWYYCESTLDYVWTVFAHQKRYAAAARYYTEAFAAEPQFLAGPQSRHRYRAACAAALAGCGKGSDAAGLDAASRAGLRRQALDWLRAELEARRRLLEQEPAKDLVLMRDMNNWQEDLCFLGVREPDALARLAESERQAWQHLWADVADTQARAAGGTPSEQRAGSTIALPQGYAPGREAEPATAMSR